MKKKIAFIFDLPKHMRARHQQVIEKYLHPKIGFDILYLIDDDEADRVLVRDMTLDLTNIIDDYMFIVPVGAEPFKKLVKHKGGVTKYNASILTEPFKCIPIISPLIVYVNPSMQPKVEECFQAILEFYNNNASVIDKTSKNYELIESAAVALDFLAGTKDKIVAYDLETTSLDPLDGHIIGASICTTVGEAVFIKGSILHEVHKELNAFLNNNTIVLHNSKFDMKWTKHELGIDITNFEDTLIGHYLFIDQTKGTHSLKVLSMKYTDLGDYSRQQDEFIKKFCRQHKILLADFNFGMIPMELLYRYACDDANATLQLYNNMLIPALSEADPLTVQCYREIMLPASSSLIDMELLGAPIDKDEIISLADDLENKIKTANYDLHSFPEIKSYEKSNGVLNLNSPAQVGNILFNYFGFTSVKETATGNPSTDVSVLTELGKQHEFPNMIIQLRKLKKLYDTYVVNIMKLIEVNGRLRGNFNLCATESGRLSSSGDEKE